VPDFFPINFSIYSSAHCTVLYLIDVLIVIIGLWRTEIEFFSWCIESKNENGLSGNLAEAVKSGWVDSICCVLESSVKYTIVCFKVALFDRSQAPLMCRSMAIWQRHSRLPCSPRCLCRASRKGALEAALTKWLRQRRKIQKCSQHLAYCKEDSGQEPSLLDSIAIRMASYTPHDGLSGASTGILRFL
jgi:hypothetical protein